MKRFLSAVSAAAIIFTGVYVPDTLAAESKEVVNDPSETVITLADTETSTKEKFYYASENISGKFMVAEMEFKRPTDNKYMWSGSKNYIMNFSIKQGAYYTVADLAGFNNNYIVTKNGTALNTSIRDENRDWLKLRVEIDVPAAEYRVIVYDKNGAEKARSEYEEIPNNTAADKAITDWGQAAVTHFSIWGRDAKDTNMSVRNVRLFTGTRDFDDEYRKISSDEEEYILFNMQKNGANCIAVTDSYDSADFGTRYAAPDYFGSGVNATDCLAYVVNKGGIDNKKDGNDIIYDESGVPFDFRTDTDKKNTLLLGLAELINKPEAEISVPEGFYKSFSFIADATYEITENTKVSVNYTDGTTDETELKMIRRQQFLNNNEMEQNRQNVLDTIFAYKNVSSCITFVPDPNNTEGTGYAYNTSNGQIPQWWSMVVPVYTVSADSDKEVKSVTFTNNNKLISVNIFSFTGVGITYDRKLAELADTLPAADEINKDNFVDYSGAIARIEALLAKGAKLDSERTAKYNALKAKYDELLGENGTLRTFHVSPKGKADNDGSSAAPFDSLAAAKKAVAEYKKKNPGVKIDVIFNEGEYRFSDSVKFTSADSGTKSAPITYKAAEGAKVYFKGSKVLNAGSLKTVRDPETLAKLPKETRGKVKYIDLKAEGITKEDLGAIPASFGAQAESNELFVNDKVQALSRWPNGENEYVQFDSVAEAGGGTQNSGGAIKIGSYRLERWENAPDAWIVGFLGNDWTYDRVGIKSIDAANKTVYLEPGAIYALSDNESKRYAVINLLEELDMPGEWYIDRENEILYYYPEGDISEIELSVTDKDLIDMENVSNVNFSGITFSQTRANAVRLREKMENMEFSDCIFENIAKYGIYQTVSTVSEVAKGTPTQNQFHENGNVNFRLNKNAFIDCGISAFSIICGSRDDNRPSGCGIVNNYIYNTGRTNKKAIAAYFEGVGIEVANNTIHSVGYGLDYHGADISIHHNEIYNALGHLNDGGAIYTGRAFINRGNKIYNNYIHDAKKKTLLISDNMAYGIYLDDLDCGTEIFGNIIAGTNVGVLVNGGMSNNVHDNIIADASGKDDYGAVGFGVYGGMGNSAKIAQQTAQGEAALKLSGYAKYTDIKEDLESGKLSYPARNIIKNNITLNAKISKWNMIPEWKYYKVPGYNTLEGNEEVGETEFVDAANGDLRLKSASSYAASTAALSESFDMSTIGIQESEFKENPIDSESFSLSYPQDGQNGIGVSGIILKWQRPRGADSFRLVVAKDDGFSDIVKDIKTYETTYTLENIGTGTYYWRVYANNESAVKKATWAAEKIYTFTVSEPESIGALETVIAAAKAAAQDMTEANLRGSYKIGTKNALNDKIAYAEKLKAFSGVSEKETKIAAADIWDIINNRIFIYNPTETTVEKTDGKYTFSVSFEEDAKGANVYAALYSKSGKLLAVSETEMEKGEKTVISAVTEEVPYTAKIFVWNGEMVPLWQEEILGI